MKTWTSLFLVLAMVSTLTACGNSGNPENTSEPPASVSGSTAEDTPAPSEYETPAVTPDTSETPVTGDSSSVLIAYFSWSGNTEQVAQIIQQETGGDLFEIAPATPYTDDYNELLDIAQQEQADNARPELAGQVENWEQYDTVFVGYPNWWSDAPMAVYTFLEHYDFTGKTIHPFCTHEGSGLSQTERDIRVAAKGAVVTKGLAIHGSSVAQAEPALERWVQEVAKG